MVQVRLAKLLQVKVVGQVAMAKHATGVLFVLSFQSKIKQLLTLQS